jgi:uncharacterized protein YbbC (DUF1343 family)
MAARVQTGLDLMLGAIGPGLLQGRRLGLLTHPAAVNARGVHAAQAIRDAGLDLRALLGPEHGFFGAGAAGEKIGDARHAAWAIPIHSLYGEQRRPTPAMLEGIDTLVIDLQDLAVRCYTYVTTLRYALEACARDGKSVVVFDRPVPFPHVVDGPPAAPAFESFVAGVPAPLVYGMTPGETARWLKAALAIDVALDVVPMRGYTRDPRRPALPPWISPSPGIRTWETAWCYPATVCCEALPAVDYGRGSVLPFQLVCADGLDAERFTKALNRLRLPGLAFAPHWTANRAGARLIVRDARKLRPVAAGIAILHALQDALGADRLWNQPGTREDFFDKLMGTDQVRLALKGGTDWKDVVASWQPDLAKFDEAKAAHVLY